jgi:transcriptional regulator with GAF, ATPase, and Fis domain
MEIEPVWLCVPSIGKAREALAQDLISELAQAGLQIQVAEYLEKIRGPGILLLGNISDEILRLVAYASHDGEQRVLVVLAEPPADRASTDGQASWQLLLNGAADVLAWPQEGLGQLVAARFARWHRIDRVLDSSLVSENLVGRSQAWRAALRHVIEAATSSSPVLLEGETGTGKELAARLIHTLDSPRKENKLVIVDCTTIVPELSGSELFGHERGAFTGAVSARDGAFATADGGSLFLDEVGELPPGLQVQLLRVLQERTYRRVGSNQWRKTEFRLICATNRDLAQEMKAGRFRSDLYYRIAGWTIELPPLRARGDDILHLARHFLKQACGDRPVPELDEGVKNYLLARPYEGNVRELMNVVERIYARYPKTGKIMPGDIPPDEWPILDQSSGLLVPEARSSVQLALENGVKWQALQQNFKDLVFRTALEMTTDRLKEAGEMLGVDVRTVQYWRNDHRRRLGLKSGRRNGRD